MKPKELMRLSTWDGWLVVRIQGLHHIHQHPVKSRTIPVTLHNTDMAPGALAKIFKAARLKNTIPNT